MGQITTYQNFVKVIEDIASRHYQINSFGIGQNFDIEASENVNYPLLWIRPIRGQMIKGDNDNYANFNIEFEIKVLDQSTPDTVANANQFESMDTDIHSDTIEILRDIITEIEGNPYFQESRLQIINDVTFEPLTEYSDNELLGWSCNIELKSINTRTFCGLPLTAVDGFSFPSPDYTGLTWTDVQYITDITNTDNNIQITHTGTTYEVNASGITTNANNISTLDTNKYDKSGGTISGDVTITGYTQFGNVVKFENSGGIIEDLDNTVFDLSGGNIFISSCSGFTNLDYVNPEIGTYIFIFKDQTINSSITFEAGKWSTIDGDVPVLTATNGAIDVFTGVYDGSRIILFIGNNILSI